MIAANLNQLIGEALRSGDKFRTEILRQLSSTLNYEKIKLQHDLSEAEEIAVIRREVKKRRDSIEIYKTSSDTAKANEHIKQEEAEVSLLLEFLPAEIDNSSLEKIVREEVLTTGASEVKDMGRVIGAVKEKVGVSVDGARIASMVKQVLGI